MAERWMIALIAGLFGLMIGSFLNICSMRWPRDRSIVRPGSYCPRCGNPLRWYHNVPVFSWLALRGRCRDGGMPTSAQYPLAELTSGLVWAGLFWTHGLSPEAARGAIFLTLLFGIALSDARFYIIPDQFSVGGTGLGLGLAFLPGGVTAIESAIGIVGGYVMLWVVGVGGNHQCHLVVIIRIRNHTLAFPCPAPFPPVFQSGSDGQCVVIVPPAREAGGGRRAVLPKISTLDIPPLDG